jgi:hypothetical protein
MPSSIRLVLTDDDDSNDGETDAPSGEPGGGSKNPGGESAKNCFLKKDSVLINCFCGYPVHRKW